MGEERAKQAYAPQCNAARCGARELVPEPGSVFTASGRGGGAFKGSVPPEVSTMGILSDPPTQPLVQFHTRLVLVAVAGPGRNAFMNASGLSSGVIF